MWNRLKSAAKKMTPEQTFEQLLGLGTSWKVIRTEYEAEHNTFVICVSETEALWAEESAKSGQTVTCYDHVEPMQWRHLNAFNKECVIVSALPRGRRSQDGGIYRVTPPWEGRSKHFTNEFEAFALTLMRELPVKKAGEIMGETDQRLWRMLPGHVEAAHAKADWSEVVRVPARRCAECHSKGRVLRPFWTRIQNPHLNSFLLAPLAKSAGGTGACDKAVFASTKEPDYLAILKTFEPVLAALRETTRTDMPGAKCSLAVNRSCK